MCNISELQKNQFIKNVNPAFFNKDIHRISGKQPTLNHSSHN